MAYAVARQRVFDFYFNHVLRRQILRIGMTGRLVTWLMRGLRLKLLFNVVPGLGHNTVELDMFFRMKALGRYGAKDRIILLRQVNEIHKDTLSLYRDRFWFASSSIVLFNFLMPAAANADDLQLDCGLSRLKWNYDPRRNLVIPVGGQTYLHQISKAENREAWKRYYQIRRETRGLAPLTDGLSLDVDLRSFLGNDERPLALVHIKQHIANATGAVTDPSHYVETIRHLRDEGFNVVQVGREQQPDEFRLLGVINYAESRLASYRHDLQLFAAASIAITAGSGIAMLADCMDTPLVYLDSWHVGMPMASARCVMVPTLVRRKSDNQLLSIREQLDLYFSLEDSGSETFPDDEYVAVNAAADEVLAAVKEVMGLEGTEPLSALQQAYRGLDRGGLGELSMSRVSDYFIERHSETLRSKSA
jgi:putative glycosyltransferase (TIGR04372 family)